MNRQSAVNLFLQAWIADREYGAVRTSAEYQALCPEFADAIAAEYEDVSAADAPSERERRIGGYRLIEEIGRGGQGTVWSAEDSRLGRTVALKVLRRSDVVGDGALSRFRREAEIASRLDHPGICTVYDTGTDDDHAWIAMKRLEGETLARRIADRGDSKTPRTRPEIDVLVQIVERAARALDAAHEAGIVHRDVKPGNIMILPDGAPVLLDFGLARDAHAEAASITRTGDFLGTPTYMSPEQLDPSAPAIDRRTDIWALGVTLYQALTGVRPFTGATHEALARAILSREPADPRTLNPRIGRDLKVVIETALQKDVDRRYATALDFAEDLRRAVAHEPIMARPAGPATRIKRWCQRNPLTAAMLAGVFLIMAIALGVTLSLNRTKDAALADRTQALDEKTRALGRYRQLSDARRVQELLARFDAELWPRHPKNIPAMDAWLREAAACASRRAQHVAAIAELDGLAMPAGAAEDGVEVRWRLGVLKQLVADIDVLDAKAEETRKMRAYTLMNFERTVTQSADAWRRCIASVSADPRFRGLLLKPQTDLIPMRKNPDTDLWEFAFAPCGPTPRIDDDDEIRLSEDSTMVFILLPGGDVLIGAQNGDPAGPNYEPAGDPRPAIHKVTLEPFFLSKYEMTQRQWSSFTGKNPSYFQPGTPGRHGRSNLRHPVEQVNWFLATDVLRRLGLGLPTEVQWEYACRGGTTTAYCSGQDVRSLAGYANIADAGSKGSAQMTWEAEPDFDDGFDGTAPVGSLKPNGFGFFDMHGNVSEWCRDFTALAPVPPRSGDGLRDVAPATGRMSRGGCYAWPASAARSAERFSDEAEFRHPRLGVRPMREIER